jgi:hypothetical protein
MTCLIHCGLLAAPWGEKNTAQRVGEEEGQLLVTTLHCCNHVSFNTQGVSGGIVNILDGGSMDYSK